MPNGVSTGPVISPGARAHATLSNWGTNWPLRTGGQVAAVARAAGILRHLRCDLGERRPALHRRDRLLGLLLRRGLLLGRRGGRRADQHVLEDADVVAVVGLAHRVGRDVDPLRHQRVMPQRGLELGDLRPHRLRDGGRIGEDLVLRDGLGEQRVVHPHVRDEVGGLVVQLRALRLENEVGEPLGRELRRAGHGRNTRARLEHVAVASREHHHRHHQQQSPHAISNLCSCHWRSIQTTALNARTSAGINASPPRRSSRKASGTVRRTSATSCTSSSAVLSFAIRGADAGAECQRAPRRPG